LAFRLASTASSFSKLQFMLCSNPLFMFDCVTQALRQRRIEDAVELRKVIKEEQLSQRRNIDANETYGTSTLGSSLNSSVVYDDDETIVRIITDINRWVGGFKMKSTPFFSLIHSL